MTESTRPVDIDLTFNHERVIIGGHDMTNLAVVVAGEYVAWLDLRTGEIESFEDQP